MCTCCEIQKLHLVVILDLGSGSCGTIGDYDGFELGCLGVPRRKLGLGTQQGSPDRYSNGEAKSLKSCVNQGDRWVIKFRLGLNLFNLIKL